ncbi:hypothetical protein [Parasitella parasitica]|uniref:Ndc10 domain-containing protein n=1 Tax=Parasitella parasitica TaxID=35722 RepID=A0A0B7N2I6_9FUNG|nr:hypothetical protein [Parasitella parasitica]
MQPILPTTQEYRRLVKRNNLESSSSSEQIPESSVQKGRCGRPKKARVDPVPVETTQNVTTSAANVGIPQHIDEVEYCERLEVDRFGEDALHPYTVGPPEKHVTIGADVRTQVSLRVDESPGPSTRLIDLTENAPMNKSGKAKKKKKIQVPIGIEAENQYKKALMAQHEFQVITRGVTWPSPKVTKEVKNIIKQYRTDLVYDQAQTNAYRAAHCIIRDSSKIGQLEEPAFLNNERQHNFKVLVDKEEGISGVQQYNSTKKIFREHGIFTSRVTHGGRHSGAMEAESLGTPIDSIKKDVPSEFARGMAGFWNKPFGLERNRADPPIELQQKIFPWIEEYFCESNTTWKKECLDEMNQIDENEFIEEDAASRQLSEKAKGKHRETAAVHQTIDAAKRGFLKLLIRSSSSRPSFPSLLSAPTSILAPPTSTSSASIFIAPITSSSVAFSSRNILPAQAETQNHTSAYTAGLLKEEPTFLNNERWHNFKMLVDKEEGISGVQQYNSTKKIFTSRVTHGGRHSGAMEAESLGIRIDSIKKGGEWKDRLGRLETHFLGKVPSEFARGMAGFWNKPFGLERNRVDP